MVYKTVSTTESQVGKYIDINGDGIPEGIIFADLAVGGKGRYGYDCGTYEIPTLKKEMKDYIKTYVISGKYNHELNGKQEILMPILDGFERFYIMALEDIDEDTFYFYKMASKEKLEFQTEGIKFGAGVKNTTQLMNSWIKEKYGPKHPKDIWGYAKKDIQKGWFIPSIDEWGAFADQLDINSENYEKKGLADDYFSSSQYNYYSYFTLSFYKNISSHEPIEAVNNVRLAKII